MNELFQMGGVIMERVYPSDFNMSENTSQESFVRVSEINDMIAYGVFKLDRNKLKEYKFDTTVMLFLTTFQAAFTRAYRKTREPRLDILVVLA